MQGNNVISHIIGIYECDQVVCSEKAKRYLLERANKEVTTHSLLRTPNYVRAVIAKINEIKSTNDSLTSQHTQDIQSEIDEALFTEIRGVYYTIINHYRHHFNKGCIKYSNKIDPKIEAKKSPYQNLETTTVLKDRLHKEEVKIKGLYKIKFNDIGEWTPYFKKYKVVIDNLAAIDEKISQGHQVYKEEAHKVRGQKIAIWGLTAAIIFGIIKLVLPYVHKKFLG